MLLNFLLYCDIPTLNCTADDINLELSTFAKSYIQVNDSLWFFKYPDGFDGSFFSKEEHLFYDHFEKFAGKTGNVFIERLTNNDFYQLPDEVCDFLSRN